MQSIAKASGATLGYIVGNLPGAYYGYQFGKYISMAPIKRKYTGRNRMNNKRRNYGVASRIRGSRTNYNVTTTQKDFSTQYKKKTMPRRKKRQWKKFIQKVKAVNREELGAKTVLFNEGVTTTTTSVTQGSLAMHLYGVKGFGSINDGIGGGDLCRIFANEPSVQQGVGPLNPLIGKLLFRSAVLDVTLHNTGNVDLEVDIYYGYHRKDVISASFVADDLKGTSLELPINGGVPNTTLDLGTRGVTVFDLPTGLSQSGFHVLKKQKMFLKSTQSSFLQYRDPRNHSLEWNRLKQCGYGGRKLTYTILVVYKTVTGVTDIGQLSFGATRKYCYCEDANTKDMSAQL